jgi:hypothetical protein
MDMGTSMACYTPIEFPVNKAIKFGAENEILIRVGERTWLPAEAAGGTDKEKEHYLPGIWDDVSLSFTGNIRINRLLVLPSVENKKVTVKALIRSLIPAQIFYGDPMNDSVRMSGSIGRTMAGRTRSGRNTPIGSGQTVTTRVLQSGMQLMRAGDGSGETGCLAS